MASLAAATAPNVLTRERWFFGGMSLLLTLFAFWGFAPSFFLRGTAPAFLTWQLPTPFTTYLDDPPQPIRALFIAHGVACTAWFLLLSAQSALVAGHRVRWHRSLGQAAFVLVPIILLLGLQVALYSARHGFHDTHDSPLQLAGFPIFLLLSFGGLAGTGLVLRRRPQAHKRLMLIASMVMTAPALGRMDVPDLSWLPSWWSWTFLFFLPLPIWDFATRRRLHPATLFGGGALILNFPIEQFVAGTAAWSAAIGALAG